MTLGLCGAFTVLSLMSPNVFSHIAPYRTMYYKVHAWRKYDLKLTSSIFASYTDHLGLLHMHAPGGFRTLMAHVQTSALFDDLDRAVSG